MSHDPALEIAHVRGILRRSLTAGRRTAETNHALERMRQLALHGGDTALRYEHRRWSVQLRLLRTV